MQHVFSPKDNTSIAAYEFLGDNAITPMILLQIFKFLTYHHTSSLEAFSLICWSYKTICYTANCTHNQLVSVITRNVLHHSTKWRLAHKIHCFGTDIYFTEMCTVVTKMWDEWKMYGFDIHTCSLHLCIQDIIVTCDQQIPLLLPQ